MKFLSSNWQEPNGFERVVSEAHCCICSSTHDLGWEPKNKYVVCRIDANMQPNAIRIVANCVIEGTRISKDVFNVGRWNSYDRDAMLPHFSNDLLLEQAAYTLKNCSLFTKSVALTYDEAIQLYAKELANRLTEQRDQAARLVTAASDLVREIGACTCSETYKSRGMSDPQCVRCENAIEINAVKDALQERSCLLGITEIVIQPIGVGESCTSDVVARDLRIERYEVRRIL